MSPDHYSKPEASDPNYTLVREEPVIVKEAMANGRLAPGGTPEADRLATTGGITSDALAIGAALAQDWAHIVLSGAVTVAQLTSNTQARALHVDLSLIHI